ncbi:MAG: excinuclease ABC subunit B [Candidatus Doudnabacteria bacterium RIFCSPHIGHO2_01_FULL_50_11]|uniref:UvrABC system protein B n=1 Tax=Candidatus Doudnabacteria bacterium RIFCSPHIGHO2_01_FULL_50_11 TaxID=1817828 RepID=A0A1F5PHM2_9BACT|nr:MAG: excinuclease ABC subunit B [Candidatus Doudnabacteria bacterium RIFCSPHIGHO2_01_FULL_50_11]HLC44913.1 excinuclease ABC subunit UvrB [Patescibacteria group bacterium]
MNKFKLISKFKPTGDQPAAIKKLVANLKSNIARQTLLGVTGSGKTFTMANVVAQVQRPTLIISHNKTLAAQLASEFQDFFPNHAVHYFVSYYDYYQPEAYIPRSDTYIEKETEINEEIDRLRNAATTALLTRRDVLIVASVSCIYGLGNPGDYLELSIELERGRPLKRDKLLRRMVDLQYSRNDIDLRRGTFRVRGEIVEIVPADTDRVVRVAFDGDIVEKIEIYDLLTGEILEDLPSYHLFPAKHFITPREKMLRAIENIRAELDQRKREFEAAGKLVEAQRLEQRTNFDVEMMFEAGYVNGVENYSRHLDFRPPGTPPSTLIDYFPDDFLLFIDESHMTVPQLRGMHEGDRARKQVLIDYGFRLPSAFDNRPLRIDEFWKKVGQTIFVSATPGPYELSVSKPHIIEQIIRPTGLLDPLVEVRPTKGQVADVVSEAQKRIKKGQRVLVTTLTKRMAEELSEHLAELGIKVTYLHSDIQTLERLEILRDLRTGAYDVLIGVNLLREGLDLPEVSLVCVLDADKEGFLRSDTSLIQLMGRAARHLEGYIIMYADRVTGSMKIALEETARRRTIQEAYNRKHHITPQGITKAISESRLAGMKKKEEEQPAEIAENFAKLDRGQQAYLLEELRDQMDLAAKNLEFERAAKLRDQISRLRLLKSKKRHRI